MAEAKDEARKADNRKIGGLGRGLNALIPQMADAEDAASAEIPERRIRLEQIKPNPYQPRHEFDEEKLSELTASIAEHGVVQPILVRPFDENYQLVAGERRVRAARLAGLMEIPALVRAMSDGEMMEISLIENIQRQELDPVEEARAYKRLSEEFGQTQEKIAKRVSKSRSYIANSMRLLQLPNPILRHLASGALTVGHVRPLLTLAEDEAMQLADRLIENKGTARDAEQWAREIADPQRQGPGQFAEGTDPLGAGFADQEALLVARKETPAVLGKDANEAEAALRKPSKALNVELKEIQQILREKVNTKVEIIPGAKGGKIVIDYYTQDDIERILELLSGTGTV